MDSIITWTQGWDYGLSTIYVNPFGNVWANDILSTYWMYIQGTYTVSECGSISLNF